MRAMKSIYWTCALVYSFGLPINPSFGQSPSSYPSLNLYGRVFEYTMKYYVDELDPWTLTNAAVLGMVSHKSIESKPDIAPPRRKPGDEASQPNRALNYFGSVFGQIQERNPGRISDRDLVLAAIAGMQKKLRYSDYIAPLDNEQTDKSKRDEIGAVGLEVDANQQSVRILRAFGVAKNAGIGCGESLLAIDAVPLSNLASSDVLSRLRGPVDSEARLTILDKTGTQRREVTVKRALNVDPGLEFSTEGNVGYIKIYNFNSGRLAVLTRVVGVIRAEIPEKKLSGYIIDVRDNSGGLLNEVVDVTDAFIRKGTISTTQGRVAEANNTYLAQPGDIADDKPIIVLVNKDTQGGAEIFAAALQDHKRATIVGVNSAGKGAIKTAFPLGAGNGSWLLTTARYVRPSGSFIEGRGVAPDYVIDQPPPGWSPCTSYKGEDDAQRTVAASLLGQRTP